MNTNHKWPIKKLLIFPGTVVTLALSAVFISAISVYSYQNLRQDFYRNFEGTARLFQENITNPLLLGQSEVVYRSCKLLIAQDSTVYVKVERPSGEVICDLGDPKFDLGGWALTFNQQIGFEANGGDPAAFVKIGYTLSELRKQVLSWITFGLLMSFFQVVVQVSLYLVLSKRVAVPLQRLTKTVQEGNTESIAAGDWRAPTAIQEIYVLNESVVQMAQRLVRFQLDNLRSERNRITSDLARQVAHDIRSPLSALKILGSKLARSGHEYAELMTSAIARMENMAGDMLEKSRGGAHETEVIHVQHALSQIIAQLELKAQSKGISLQFVAGPGKGRVWLNVPELERVITNLVENALDVSKSGQRVDVECNQNSQFWSIEVRDEGPGLTTDLAARLGREEVNSTKPGGNGLGIFKAYSMVASWGGRIRHHTNAKQGLCFVVEIQLQA